MKSSRLGSWRLFSASFAVSRRSTTTSATPPKPSPPPPPPPPVGHFRRGPPTPTVATTVPTATAQGASIATAKFPDVQMDLVSALAPKYDPAATTTTTAAAAVPSPKAKADAAAPSGPQKPSPTAARAPSAAVASPAASFMQGLRHADDVVPLVAQVLVAHHHAAALHVSRLPESVLRQLLGDLEFAKLPPATASTTSSASSSASAAPNDTFATIGHTASTATSPVFSSDVARDAALSAKLHPILAHCGPITLDRRTLLVKLKPGVKEVAARVQLLAATDLVLVQATNVKLSVVLGLLSPTERRIATDCGGLHRILLCFPNGFAGAVNVSALTLSVATVRMLALKSGHGRTASSGPLGEGAAAVAAADAVAKERCAAAAAESIAASSSSSSAGAKSPAEGASGLGASLFSREGILAPEDDADDAPAAESKDVPIGINRPARRVPIRVKPSDTEAVPPATSSDAEVKPTATPPPKKWFETDAKLSDAASVRAEAAQHQLRRDFEALVGYDWVSVDAVVERLDPSQQATAAAVVAQQLPPSLQRMLAGGGANTLVRRRCCAMTGGSASKVGFDDLLIRGLQLPHSVTHGYDAVPEAVVELFAMHDTLYGTGATPSLESALWLAQRIAPVDWTTTEALAEAQSCRTVAQALWVGLQALPLHGDVFPSVIEVKREGSAAAGGDANALRPTCWIKTALHHREPLPAWAVTAVQLCVQHAAAALEASVGDDTVTLTTVERLLTADVDGESLRSGGAITPGALSLASDVHQTVRRYGGVRPLLASVPSVTVAEVDGTAVVTVSNTCMAESPLITAADVRRLGLVGAVWGSVISSNGCLGGTQRAPQFRRAQGAPLIKKGSAAVEGSFWTPSVDICQALEEEQPRHVEGGTCDGDHFSHRGDLFAGL